MSEKEKIFLIQCLLYDIRLNWSTSVKRRAELAKKLCLEIGSDDFLTLAKECDTFLSYDNIDGRFFRYEFPNGYENMDNLHGLSHTLQDKSDEFNGYATEYLTCIEHIFNDVSL